ncbi:P-type DNA transfer protein VirB5 [Verminephrobacter aporrectodeae subsp. tuberculatae]|uniref:P-type DNA transfer protein VirB5 n=1 Tax=Verminephrobacter aporrectodeae TaxID=1110389 RepID=UPI000237852A|nr:P-type DNA transfer protein VirB5 [Verminephrobacter aporrectodeae]MCW8166983.1 P-type DNA transfer protein VirB5 [Verminephrobacter aporrectodeae subsp. tuberculatae]MCW8171175.1 P-type DNA transfer protein VirB5 [Verminephrobacter aporrectodeae subsp. tuberculatae]
MKAFKKLFGAITLFFGLAIGNSAQAGLPVIDAANLAQAVHQVAAWGEQAAQMKKQIEQMKQQYESMNGTRGMGSLVNNPPSRQYLPEEYKTILQNGVGQWEAIYNAAKKFDISTTTLAGNSDTVQAFQAVAKQAAINRATAEEGYKAASKRFADIQVLLDRINTAPEAKDIADLQARIQVEQVMLQNEANKLTALQMLASAQRDLHTQQIIELRMKSSKGGLPAGW